MTLYVVYLTWSAMTSETGRLFFFQLERYQSINLDSTCNPSWYGVKTNGTTVNSAPSGSASVGVSSIVGLIIFFTLILYSV